MFIGDLITTDGMPNSGHRFSVCINTSDIVVGLECPRYRIKIAHASDLNSGECNDLWAMFEDNMRDLCVRQTWRSVTVNIMMN